VLYGGDNNSAFHDTWEWDGTSWQAIATAVSPTTGFGLMAFDSSRGIAVLYDHGNAPPTTWEFIAAGTATASYSPFGSGCSGPSGVPDLNALGASVPRIGGTFQTRLSNLPSSPFNLPFIVLGFDATTWNNVPLPISLDPLGFTGCQAWIAPEYSTALANVNGVADWSIAVPLDLDLLGAAFFLQGAVMAPTWNPGGIVFSNAGHAVIGTP
jgi:hypothetical protein